jgi:hypothetical protein
VRGIGGGVSGTQGKLDLSMYGGNCLGAPLRGGRLARGKEIATARPRMDQCASRAHSRSGSVTDVAVSTRSTASC